MKQTRTAHAVTRLLATAGIALALGACESGPTSEAAPESQPETAVAEDAAAITDPSQIDAIPKHELDEIAFFRDTAQIAAAQNDHETAWQSWVQVLQRDPSDLEALVSLGYSLRMVGRYENGVTVLLQGLSKYPSNMQIREELGKTLVAANRPKAAIDHLQAVAETSPDNWRVRSALGIAYDRLGDAEKSRGAFEGALRVSPGNPSVLNNFALSLAMNGKLDEAERVIRMAAAVPNAGAQVRQNHALILGMDGRFEEARRVATADLPGPIAQHNLDVLRAMLASPNRWDQIQ